MTASLGASLFAAACTSSNAKPTTTDYDDTAQAIASATSASNAGASGGGGDVTSMADTVSLSLGVVPTGISLMGDGHFQGSRLGVDYNYSLTCKSAAGVAGACSPLTDQASADVTWSGSLSTPGIDASVMRSGSWTVTGLQGGTATFAGDSSFSFDATLRSIFRPGVTTTYHFDFSGSYDAVKITTADRKVVDGSASFTVTAQHMVTGQGANDVDVAFHADAVLTFHADQTADLVLDSDQKYTLNLVTGVVARVSAPN